jgi:hypothetical protein
MDRTGLYRAMKRILSVQIQAEVSPVRIRGVEGGNITLEQVVVCLEAANDAANARCEL